MSSLTFQLPTEKANRLAEAAQKIGIPVEELLEKLTDEFLDRKNAFETAAQ
jgi:hypothetical protein